MDRTESALYETVLRQSGTDVGKFPSDEEALRRVVRKDGATPQGVNILKAALNAMVRRATEGEGEKSSGEPPRVRFLPPQAEPVPLNLTALPGLIAFEVIVLGFTFVAVFIFQEKHGGTIKAHRVSPGQRALTFCRRPSCSRCWGASTGAGSSCRRWGGR
ncbi:MAG: hypothetical protein ACM3X3_00580 [Betaproteobacteria bacterium]